MRLANWSFAWHLLGGDQSILFEDRCGHRLQISMAAIDLSTLPFYSRAFISLFIGQQPPVRGADRAFHRRIDLAAVGIAAPIGATQARRELEIEALKQVHDDGVDREQATWYHHSVADMMLLAGLVGRANSIDFSGSYWARLESMLEFIASIMDVNGNVPCFGDSDDGVMVRFSPSRDFQVYRSLLATGAVLFSRADFKAKARHFDDKSRWLLGDSAGESFESIKAESVTAPRASIIHARRVLHTRRWLRNAR